MKGQKRETAEWGFRIPTPGWHTVQFQEGIEILTNEATGKKSLIIPTVIDEESDDAGIKLSIFAPVGQDFGEQKVADVLSVTELYDAFEKKFPGDVSVFQADFIEGLKIKLPGKFAKMKVEASKDGKYSNVIGVANIKVEDPDKLLPKGKGGKGAASTGKGKPASAKEEGWD